MDNYFPVSFQKEEGLMRKDEYSSLLRKLWKSKRFDVWEKNDNPYPPCRPLEGRRFDVWVKMNNSYPVSYDKVKGFGVWEKIEEPLVCKRFRR